MGPRQAVETVGPNEPGRSQSIGATSSMVVLIVAFASTRSARASARAAPIRRPGWARAYSAANPSTALQIRIATGVGRSASSRVMPAQSPGRTRTSRCARARSAAWAASCGLHRSALRRARRRRAAHERWVGVTLQHPCLELVQPVRRCGVGLGHDASTR